MQLNLSNLINFVKLILEGIFIDFRIGGVPSKCLETF